MSYQLFEVWQEDDEGHEQLISTTASKKEAMNLAEQALKDANGIVAIYQENEEMDLDEVCRLTKDDAGAIINV